MSGDNLSLVSSYRKFSIFLEKIGFLTLEFRTSYLSSFLFLVTFPTNMTLILNIFRLNCEFLKPSDTKAFWLLAIAFNMFQVILLECIILFSSFLTIVEKIFIDTRQSGIIVSYV